MRAHAREAVRVPSWQRSAGAPGPKEAPLGPVAGSSAAPQFGRDFGQVPVFHVSQQASATSPPLLQRYAHKHCQEDDLKQHIWLSDGLANRMTKHAVSVLNDSSKLADPTVKKLLKMYFKSDDTSTVNFFAIKTNYAAIASEFDDDDYTYACEETDCADNEAGYAGRFVGSMHLCMPVIRKWERHCIARLMIHEFMHRYGHMSDEAYCDTNCDGEVTDPSQVYGCPNDLDPDVAPSNPDSYAGFAWAIWEMGL